MKKLKYILPVVLVLIVVFACSDSSGGGSDDDGGDDFDRVELTTSWVNNLLEPAINDLKTKLETLNTSAVSFTAAPDTNGLTQLRLDLLEAAKVWQHVELFFYGSSFALDMYSYPTDAEGIEDNVVSDIELNLDRTVLNDTQGLPAIDYLINGLDATDEAIIAKYQDEAYVDYLKLLTSRMVTITDEAITEFQTNKTANLASVNNTISSYFSLQVNDYIQYTERSFREAKIATPSGTRNRFDNISANPSPESVESIYSPNNSKTLYLEAYDAIQDFYYGRSYENNSDIVGLQEYLQFLGTTILIDNSDILLNDYIEDLFDNIDTANTNITDNFYEQTGDYNTNFDAVFDAIQNYVIAIKSNMIDAFNLTIDFVDSDGD